MTDNMYSRKIIQNLKPKWYLELTKKQKLAEQNRMKASAEIEWVNKPAPIPIGTMLVAKGGTKSNVTEGKRYIVKGYFATLVTTICSSNWNEFVIIKNDFGHTVKMNKDNFIISNG